MKGDGATSHQYALAVTWSTALPAEHLPTAFDRPDVVFAEHRERTRSQAPTVLAYDAWCLRPDSKREHGLYSIYLVFA
jgi:hypothetical protein